MRVHASVFKTHLFLIQSCNETKHWEPEFALEMTHRVRPSIRFEPELRETLPSLLEPTDSSTGKKHPLYGLEFVPPKRRSKYIKSENCLYDL